MMNLYQRALLCIFLLLASWPSFSIAQQDTTLVYSRPGIEKDPLRAKFKKSVAKKDSLWVVDFTDRKGVLQETISFADEGLTIRKGPYARYENGNLQEEGNYNRGYEVGEWTTYYANKKIRGKRHYTWGKLSGPLIKYWENGQVKEQTTFSNGNRTGDRNVYYADGRPAMKEFYNGDKITGTYFDKDGKAANALQLIQPPSYQGGMSAFYDFVGRTIKYPVEAMTASASGTVRLMFLVQADGKIGNIKAVSSPHEALTKEAIRIINKSPKWIPATELGDPIPMNFMVPINFSLAQQ